MNRKRLYTYDDVSVLMSTSNYKLYTDIRQIFYIILLYLNTFC